MNMMTGIGSVPSPTHPAKEFLAHETEFRSALKPLLDGLLKWPNPPVGAAGRLLRH